MFHAGGYILDRHDQAEDPIVFAEGSDHHVLLHAIEASNRGGRRAAEQIVVQRRSQYRDRPARQHVMQYGQEAPALDVWKNLDEGPVQRIRRLQAGGGCHPAVPRTDHELLVRCEDAEMKSRHTTFRLLFAVIGPTEARGRCRVRSWAGR